MSRFGVRRRVRGAVWLARGASDRLDRRRFAVRHPRRRARPSAVTRTPEAVVAAGLGFLAETRRDDGLWRGFLMVPGASTEWVSIHVALLLEAVEGAGALCDAVVAAVESGAREAGLGYNRRIRVDTDSTSQALAVLAHARRPVGAGFVRTVIAARHRDGGFSTYAPTGAGGTPAHGWEMPHADVTLMALLGLERSGAEPAAARAARNWLEGSVAEGIPSSYWWADPAYSLWAGVCADFRLEAAAGRAAALLPDETRPVHLAMLLSAACAGGGPASEIRDAVDRLIAAQLADGSWPCEPCLRLTDARHAHGPGAPGRAYADPYRVFSTAHAIAAISRAKGRGDGPGLEDAPSVDREQPLVLEARQEGARVLGGDGAVDPVALDEDGGER